jgi:hypothetical protein
MSNYFKDLLGLLATERTADESPFTSLTAGTGAARRGELGLCWYAIAIRNTGANAVARNEVMPYNNAEWGKEKSLSLLEDIVTCVELLSDIEAFEYEDALKDKLGHLYRKIGSMSWNSSKILAFFSNAKWETKDREAIMNKGRDGLDELKKIYE